ncbi:ArsR/SmtB family transcription factor [Microbacterium lacticum]|nr:winged helix-turn-helix domain-containing protein [Microbacterium lacticum]GEB96315.1 hypothetical protein MLA01_25340 [Microbacterium lacticum]GGN11733.1 hypothetical protein GCM10009724_01210 [Microbacterium lacticum]
MPRYTRPANSEHAEDPINTLGNRVRAMIIGYLREHPDSLRAEITAALDIPKATTAKALATLVEYGLVVPDPPRETATRGQWVRYRVDATSVSELYLQLGQVLGEV